MTKKHKTLINPQQAKFLAGYTNPQSQTFGNAFQSALAAGYSIEYAESITSKDLDWLAENVGDMQLLTKAERVMNKTLDLDATNSDGSVNSSILAIQNKTSHFVAGTLGKKKYSTRTEVTGADGALLHISFDPAFNTYKNPPDSEAA